VSEPFAAAYGLCLAALGLCPTAEIRPSDDGGLGLACRPNSRKMAFSNFALAWNSQKKCFLEKMLLRTVTLAFENCDVGF